MIGPRDRPLREPRILYDPPWIRYRIAGVWVAEQPLHTLRRVIEVQAGQPLYSTEISFDLLDFADTLWVVPDDAWMLQTHLSWADHLRAIRGYFQAQMFWPPRRWLDGGFLGLGLLRQPAARVLQETRLPLDDESWRMQGPLDPVTCKSLQEDL